MRGEEGSWKEKHLQRPRHEMVWYVQKAESSPRWEAMRERQGRWSGTSYGAPFKPD